MESVMLYQVVQVLGSVLILGAFVAAQFGLLDQAGYRYLIPNALGSAVLTATAVVNREWGFILLEGVWALVSLYSIVRRATNRRSADRRNRLMSQE
jgi:hypothetical protein